MSTAWITPLEAITSNRTMKALAALDLSCMNLSLVALSSSPARVVRLVVPGGKFLPSILPSTRCLSSNPFSSALLLSKLLSVSTGTWSDQYISISVVSYSVESLYLTLLKAVFVGANTVKGPGCLRVSSRSAAFRAVRRVENLGLVVTRSATVSPEVLVSTGLADTELVPAAECWLW